MKTLFWGVGLLIIGSLVIAFSSSDKDERLNDLGSAPEGEDGNIAEEARTMVTDGSYQVIVDDSSVFWAGKKPLVNGYINTGSMAIKEGSIEIDDGAVAGNFIIDMDTLSVTDTPAKPGKEDILESHLKGDGWFNVAEFPEAKFVIKEVSPQADVENTFMYDVKGDLTMKGETHELIFPALIYSDTNDGRTHASASLEFDRTKWGITAGSGSFFDNLADNVVDDMVALSFELIAEQN